ncbi:MAG: BCAM0308 family protein [Burkholderiales bacterium]
MTKRTTLHEHVAQPRRYGAHSLDSVRHDPYEPTGKYPDCHCGACGAAYTSGRWHWSDERPGNERTCPACRRIADHMPAGRLTLHGPYVAAHRDELVRIARHEDEVERGLHPMHRIMEIEAAGDAVSVTTTDVHLPQRIGEALRRAHDGTLEIAFSDAGYEIRVDWRR